MNDNEKYLIQQFEQVIQSEQQNIPKLLDLEKQIIQFDVKSTALPNHFKVVLSDNESGGPQLYLNNHFTSIHYEDSFPDFKYIKRGDLEKQILEDIYQHDSSFLQFDINQETIEKEMIDVGYKRAYDDIEQQQKNPLTSTFQYDCLTNEYLGVESQVVSNISFKNFNIDDTPDNNPLGQIAQIEQKTQNKNNIENIKESIKHYKSENSIIEDFKMLGEQVEQYFNELKNKQYSISKKKKFENQQYLTSEQLDRIHKFDRVISIFQKAKKKEAKKKETYGISEKDQDPEQIFKQLKSQWEEEIQEEQEMQQQPEQQILAHLDFDTMIEKVEEKIQYQEQLEQEKLKKLLEEENSLNFVSTEDAYQKGDTEKSKLFNNIKLGDQSEIADKKLQLTSRYDWAVEDNFSLVNFDQIVPKEKMAQQYPFELDTFQKRSVYRMERGESVFVCAHTSAGKTVVAEYAIALSNKFNRKAIYTSPIKALSNQKYRDFKLKYGDDVGLITGDVTLNPTANCLIVTTEILRNMLYKNSDIVRDIQWVIFDEVHYVNNPERGVVWEETIIMLPETVGFVMLSATVPNYMDFANWVGRTKKRKIYVQKTDYRPVPLEHSMYVNGELTIIKQGDEPFNQASYDSIRQKILLVNNEQSQVALKKKKLKLEKLQKGTFKNTNMSVKHNKTMKAITERYIKTTNEDDYNDSSNTSEGFSLKQLLIKCNQENLLPCVVFVFSKNKILELSQMVSSLNFCDYEESVLIEQYFKKCARKIKQRDLNVPQIQNIKQLLLRGIGIHHGDVIPFVKEVVEILFSQGLIKVLFATETFAMGINMPTKTVIFQSLKKFDSQGQRLLNSSEYTQMAGRAGRRGLDTKGNVIIFLSDIGNLPTRKDLAIVLDQRGQILESKFKVSYETIINLLNSNVLNIIDMMKKSYQENHKYAQLPNNIRRLKELKEIYLELQSFKCIKLPPSIDKPPIEDYMKQLENTYKLANNYFGQVKLHIAEKMELPSFCVMYDSLYRFYFGMIIFINVNDKYKERLLYVLYVDRINSTNTPQFDFEEDKFEHHVVENFHYCDDTTFEEYTYKIYKISLSHIVKIYNDDPTIDDGELDDPQYINDCVKILIGKQKNFKEQFISDKLSKTKMKRKQYLDMEFKATQLSKSALSENLDEIYNSLCHNCEIKQKHMDIVIKRKEVKTEIEDLIKKIDENDLNQRNSFESKLRVLKEYKYVDIDNKPTFRARIAKEIQNLYVTELVLQDYFDYLNECDIAAILSGFVCQTKSKYFKFDPYEDFDQSYSNYTFLIDAYTHIIDETRDMIKSEIKHGAIVAADANDYLFETVYLRDLMGAVFNWMSGMDFQDICKSTQIQEGAIVRSFLRLENLLKNVRNGYIIMGNYAMSFKLDRCMEMLKKDIIFQKSLYLDQDQ